MGLRLGYSKKTAAVFFEYPSHEYISLKQFSIEIYKNLEQKGCRVWRGMCRRYLKKQGYTLGI